MCFARLRCLDVSWNCLGKALGCGREEPVSHVPGTPPGELVAPCHPVPLLFSL